MIKLIQKPWAVSKRLFALAFPMLVGDASDDEAGRWPARGLLLTTVLIVLGLINNWSRLGLANTNDLPEPINRLWLPLFVLTVYACIWVAWWLWRLLHTPDVGPVSDFPDIDEAWRKAIEALSKAGIHLETTPLFLILGRPSDTEESLFQASGIKAQVNQVPRDPSEPLHVTANRDGVWLTCPGASLMSERYDNTELGTTDGGPFDPAEDAVDPYKTVAAPMKVSELLQSLAVQKTVKGRPAPRSATEIETTKARLSHLCRLIARDRRGLCPINGVLLLLPITAIDPGRDIEELAKYCRLDLTVAFESFRMRCPVLALVCGLESLPGFAEVLERLPFGQGTSRMRRMGQRFPLVPELKLEDVPRAIEEGVDWVAKAVFSNLVYSLFRCEMPGGEDVKDAIEGNVQLFRFLSEIRRRQEHLSRIVSACLPTTLGEPMLFGGCYFAATGSDAASQHAFAQGVFRRMVEDQDHVTWTAEALAEDAQQHRLARVLGGILTALLVLGLVLIAASIAWKLLLGADST